MLSKKLYSRWFESNSGIQTNKEYT
jgi:hypothetical protein